MTRMVALGAVEQVEDLTTQQKIRYFIITDGSSVDFAGIGTWGIVSCE